MVDPAPSPPGAVAGPLAEAAEVEEQHGVEPGQAAGVEPVEALRAD